MKRNRFLTSVLSGVLFFNIQFAFADEWADIRARDVAQLSEGWSTPVYLGVNDYDGWIDSLHVSEDGKTIYYVFYPGADLINDSITGNLKGDADIYYSEWPFKEHKPLKKYFMSEQPFAACCVQLDREGNFWYQSNREGRPGGSAQGNYDWQPVYRNDQLLGFNKKGRPFGDTFYCPAKDELWICEGEDHSGGQMNIFKNAKANNFSGKPEKAPQPMREGGQPYLTPDCDTMYFTANFGDTTAQGPVIYRTQRTGDKWGKAVPVAWSNLGVGEWTMTADGQKAFFVQLFRNNKNEMRIKAFSTEKKTGSGGASQDRLKTSGEIAQKKQEGEIKKESKVKEIDLTAGLQKEIEQGVENLAKNLVKDIFSDDTKAKGVSKTAPSAGASQGTAGNKPKPAAKPVSGACSIDSQDTDDPALVNTWNTLKIKAVEDLQIAPGWGRPELVKGGVNTIGWEDSAFISVDGETLYFAYLNVDLLSFVMGGDPSKMDSHARGPARGSKNTFTGMIAKRAGEAFCDPAKFPYARPEGDDFAAMQSADGRWYYGRHADSGGRDLFRDGKSLPPPVQTSGTEDNPHVIKTSYGLELFFDGKDRPSKPKAELWITREEGGKWAVPVPIASPIDLPNSEEIQPHLTAEGVLYFSSDRDGMTSIWMSQRKGQNNWEQPTKVLWPTGSAIAGVGEPTLTADGQWLYFVAVFHDRDRGQYDADVGRVRRLESGGAAKGPFKPKSEDKVQEISYPTESKKPLAVETAKQKNISVDKFQGIGGTIDLKKKGASLEWNYQFSDSNFPMLIWIGPSLHEFKGLELKLLSEKETTVAVILTETGGVRYDYHVNIQAGESKTINISWKDFKNQAETPDPNKRLDINRVESFAFFDLGGFAGKKGKNTIKIEYLAGH